MEQTEESPTSNSPEETLPVDDIPFEESISSSGESSSEEEIESEEETELPVKLYRIDENQKIYLIRVNQEIVGWAGHLAESREVAGRVYQKILRTIIQQLRGRHVQLYNFHEPRSGLHLLHVIESWWYWPFSIKESYIITVDGPIDRFTPEY